MKHLLLAVVLVAFTVGIACAETKRVCHTDPKTKKEVCKNVKMHKKLEGTAVPEKKKK